MLEAKAEGLPTLISDIPVHREFHSGSSLFPLGDDGSVLAAHLHQLRRDHHAWQQLSRAGYGLAQQLSVAAQVAQLRELIAAVASP